MRGPGNDYRERLVELLSQDLDFHNQESGYASHNFHSFPAKFPPQLPRKFIEALTGPGELILDPMVGSGTTVVEAYLTGRRAIGCDIDPLALMLSQVKVTPLDIERATRIGQEVLAQARSAVRERRTDLEHALTVRWDSKTRAFVDYWFAPQTQVELLALITQIAQVKDADIRAFLELAFSAIIITKSGGVSLALDLAHTRPHRVKTAVDRDGRVIVGHDLEGGLLQRRRWMTKTLRSPLEEFAKRVQQNLKGLLFAKPLQPALVGLGGVESVRYKPHIMLGNAQSLPLDDDCIDLIVTSPPYASNAIDYMRAHKFSLVWLGYPIDDLGRKRKEYIGGEAVTGFAFEDLPDRVKRIVTDVGKRDRKKGQVLHRYYSEMSRVLREMFRVLKPGRAAIVVVGNSVMRGRNTETQTCLAEIGQHIGFQVPKIGVRNLDRNRRMMPAGANLNLKSQIQQRMHREYVIGFYKPEGIK